MEIASMTVEWAAIVAGAVALAANVVALVVAASVRRAVEQSTKQFVELQLRRELRRADLDDPETAARYLEEWLAEMDALEDRPLARLAFALRVRAPESAKSER